MTDILPMATTSTSTCRNSNHDLVYQHDEPMAAEIAAPPTTTTTTYCPSSTNSCDTNIHVRIVPSIDDPNRCFIFNIVERDLKPGNVIKVGRFADHHLNDEHISLRSKVVSRMHCELWLGHNGKLYLRDTKSSSGTYVNHMRLTSTQQTSRPVEIHDGDLVQLGVDYQDGMEPCYRAVKMRFEVNRPTRPATNNAAAFHNLKTLTNSTQVSEQHPTSSSSAASEEDDCCICLYALKAQQALFVAPCSHSFHFKCIRPLLASYPGFQCPMCRSYSDLRHNEEEVEEKIADAVEEEQHQQQPVSSPRTSNVGSSDIHRPNQTEPLTLATSVTHMSGMDTAANHHHEDDQHHARQHHEVVIATTPPRQTSDRRLNPIHLMDKLKMAFTEKRRTSLIRRHTTRHNNNDTTSSDDEENSHHQHHHHVASATTSGTTSPATSPITPTFSVHSNMGHGGIAVLTDLHHYHHHDPIEQGPSNRY